MAKTLPRIKVVGNVHTMLNWLRKFYIPVVVQITLPFMLLALAVSAGRYISTGTHWSNFSRSTEAML